MRIYPTKYQTFSSLFHPGKEINQRDRRRTAWENQSIKKTNTINATNTNDDDDKDNDNNNDIDNDNDKYNDNDDDDDNGNNNGNNTPNANMAYLTAGPGLVARKRGQLGFESFVLTARLSD